jgi:hypothetical protein
MEEATRSWSAGGEAKRSKHMIFSMNQYRREYINDGNAVNYSITP